MWVIDKDKSLLKQQESPQKVYSEVMSFPPSCAHKVPGTQTGINHKTPPAVKVPFFLPTNINPPIYILTSIIL